jgi:hypothetical protein
MGMALILLGIGCAIFAAAAAMGARHARRADESGDVDPMLDAALRGVRFNKMLSYLGADRTQYLTTASSEEIDRHLQRCRKCPSKHTCDRCLGYGKRVQDMHFCPNYDELMLLSSRITQGQARKTG